MDMDYKINFDFSTNVNIIGNALSGKTTLAKYLVNKFYLDYDFIPFLKDVLLTNAVSPNDQTIFCDFVKAFIDRHIDDLLNDSNKCETLIERLKKRYPDLESKLDTRIHSQINLEYLKNKLEEPEQRPVISSISPKVVDQCEEELVVEHGFTRAFTGPNI